MYQIVKSILGKTGADYQALVEFLLSKSELLSSQEKGYLQFLRDSSVSAGQFPSEVLFVNQFPESKAPLSKATELNLQDLQVHSRLFIAKRQNLGISRKLIQVANRVASSGFSLSDLEEIRGLYRATSPVSTAFELGLSGVDALYRDKKSRPSGLLTFIKPVDEAIGALSMGTVNVLGGFVGSYKTTLLTNMMYNNCVRLGYNIAYLSLEVSREDMMFNLLSRHSFDPKFTRYPYIPHEKIRRCNLTDDEEEFLMKEVLPDLQSAPGKFVIIQDSDLGSYSYEDIQSVLERVDDQIGGLDALFVDHLQLLKFATSRAGMSDLSVLNDYVSFFRRLSLDFRGRQIVVVLASQINREGWQRAVKRGGRYDLLALSECNELERAAYRILTIFVDEDLKQSREARVQLLKNRSGQTIVDPVSIFVDPVSYVAGDELVGFNDMVGVDDFDSVLGS